MDILDEYMGSKYSHACPNRRAIDNGYSVADINMIGIRSYEKDEVVFKDNNPNLLVITSDEFRKTNVSDIINKIKSKIGLSSLPDVLEEMANLRLENPDANLKELGELTSPPISKSGANHRLKSIIKIAEEL